MQPRQLHDDHIVISRHKRGYASYEPLTKSFNLAMTKLQIRYRSPYNARHTCATMMLESGMEPAYCAHVLGHFKRGAPVTHLSICRQEARRKALVG